MQKIDRKIAVSMIKNAGDKIFTVTYTKRTDNSKRVMNCRLGVSKKVSGKGMSFDPKSNDLIVVYDMQKRGYRMVSIEGILELKIAGNSFEIQ